MKAMARKRGQVHNAGAIATFVLLLMLFILLYMLLVPQEERERILNETTKESEIEVEVIEEGNVIFSTSPGEVLSLNKEEIKRILSPVAIFSKKEEEIVQLASELRVERTLFKDNYKNLYFNLDDNVNKVSLVFLVKESSGDLKISLNNVEIVSDVPGRDAIILPKSYLKEENNIRLATSLNGAYTLSNVLVKIERSVESKKAKRSFVLSDSEFNGVEDITLSYFVNCMSIDKQGTLKVSVNNRLLSSDYVICDAGEITIDIPKESLTKGENFIDFEIDKGDYKIANIELNIKLSKKYYPVYNFDIDELDNEVFLKLNFEDNKRKKAAVTINEKQVNFDTTDLSWEIEITDFLNIGNNFVKIIPKVDFSIKSLKIYEK